MSTNYYCNISTPMITALFLWRSAEERIDCQQITVDPNKLI